MNQLQPYIFHVLMQAFSSFGLLTKKGIFNVYQTQIQVRQERVNTTSFKDILIHDLKGEIGRSERAWLFGIYWKLISKISIILSRLIWVISVREEIPLSKIFKKILITCFSFKHKTPKSIYFLVLLNTKIPNIFYFLIFHYTRTSKRFMFYSYFIFFLL